MAGVQNRRATLRRRAIRTLPLKNALLLGFLQRERDAISLWFLLGLGFSFLFLLGTETLLGAAEIKANHLFMELVPVACEQQAGKDKLALALHGCPKNVQAQFDVCAVLPVVQSPVTLVFPRSCLSLDR